MQAYATDVLRTVVSMNRDSHAGYRIWQGSVSLRYEVIDTSYVGPVLIQ